VGIAMLRRRVQGHLARVAARLFAQMASALPAIGPTSAARSAGRLSRKVAIDRPAFVDTQADWRKL